MRAAEGSLPDADRPVLVALERSKYALRVLMLLYASGPATFNELVRRIRASPSTAARCLRQLESDGLISGEREPQARGRHVYGLTTFGGLVVASAPCA